MVYRAAAGALRGICRVYRDGTGIQKPGGGVPHLYSGVPGFLPHHDVFTADASRIAASVVSGIGFLGAGTIIVTGKHRIKGLTTAAGLWACACMGIALGSGFYTGALVTFLLILFSMTVLGRLDRTLYKKTRVVRFFVEFGSISQVKFFISCMKEHQVKIQSFETYQDITRHSDLVTLVALTEMARDRDVQALIEDIRQMDGVTFVEVIG